MQVEEYLDFLDDRDIRIRGTRVGIETILLAYLDDKLTAEQIAAQYPSVALEQIYGAILCYLHYRDKMDGYLESYIAGSRLRQEPQAASLSPMLRSLRETAARRPSAVG